jgi:hypothetical protein
MKKILLIVIGILVLTGGVTTGGEITKADPPDIKVTLALDKRVYVPGDAINIVMTLASKSNIITSKGFSDRKFYLFLRFYDDNGKVITSGKSRQTNVGPPQQARVLPDGKGRLVQGDFVENIDKEWVLSFGPFNAYDFYPLANRGGYFTVKVVIPMRTYPKYSVISSGIKYAPLDSANWHGVLESNIVKFKQIVDAD